MMTIGGRFQAAALIGAAAVTLAFVAGARAQNQNSLGQNSNGNPWPYGNPTPDNTWPYATIGRSPVLAVVGDVACQPGEEPSGEKAGENCDGDTAQNLNASQAATAKQIENMKPDLVALLGDEQYQVGQYSDFENSYELTYGAFKSITRPSPGNHEFYTEHGAIGVAGYGYFSYFNGVQHNADGSMMMTTIANNPDTGGTFTQPVPYSDGQAGHFEQSGGLGNSTSPAGGPVGVGDGWYSYNLGAWHLISLNIECETQPGSCTGSWFAAELAWLKKDLAANHSACTLAYWHQPSYSAADSLAVPEGPTALAFWQLLYQYGADLVLNGHDHLYARYRPLDPSGNYDPHKGIREFIVGTGGETLDTVVSSTSSTADAGAQFNAANLEASSGQFWGVMALTLDPNGYKWDFESALKDPAQTTGGPTYSDKGVGTCHGPVNRDNY
jgi:acid phosphatase type 7